MLLAASAALRGARAEQLEVVTWNAQCLNGAALDDLHDARAAWAAHVGQEPDVVAIQETQLGPSSEVALDGYAAIRKDNRRGARGLLVFARLGLVAVREPRLEHDDGLLVVFPTLTPETWVYDVYRRGSNSAADDAAFYASLAAVADDARAARAQLLIVGDLNARGLEVPQRGGRWTRATSVMLARAS